MSDDTDDQEPTTSDDVLKGLELLKASPPLPPPGHAAPSPVEKRLTERAVEIMMDGDAKEILFQHSALCQTYFPYRDPKTVRRWTRTNGRVSMLMQAGEIIDPVTLDFKPVGLPFGTKARLVVAHLNTRALQVGSNVIPIEEGSFTAFVKSMQDPLRDHATAPNGRELLAYKEQITRFSVARLTLAVSLDEGRALQADRQIIEQLNVVWSRDDRQRVMWPDTITLTPSYWDSLQRHAVPLDARSLAALAHNALAIDLYQWLAQRLHRIPEGKDVRLSRALLHRQFGEGYEREQKFWEVFQVALRQALAVYRHARVYLSDADELVLQHSLPSVPRRFFAVPKLPGESSAAKPPAKGPATGEK